ncbi:MAG: hypothetical protein V5A39_03325 [Haloarculaceae archaeon]
MKLPRGQLVRRRVVEDPRTALQSALEADLTGYARLESQDALLLDADGVGVLTFEAGVPVAAYHTGTDNAGPEALADIAVAGPYRLGLYELDAEGLEAVHETEAFRVDPGMPAERLAGDAGLASRTRKKAPDERSEDEELGSDEASPVEAFLDDEERIETIRKRAREEARQRAEEWDLR